MEKKTIGKFISVLRKANGMTQKELGEKLFVSDKTVSRWECDECTPELSLIPSIAEIFSVTTDELLRGERNNPYREAPVSEDDLSRQKAKSDKQFNLMLARKTRKYKKCTLISFGITLFGFLAALIANLGFSKGLIAFCLATAFCVVSEICQVCFAINACSPSDEDEDTYTDRIRQVNTNIAKTAVALSFTNLVLFFFCLPLVTVINGANSALSFESWLGYGFLMSAAAFMVCYVLYALALRKVLCEKGIFALSEKQEDEIKEKNKLLIKAVSVAVLIAVIIGICIGVWYIIGWQTFLKEQTFDTCAEFKSSMESDYNLWFKENYGSVLVNGEEVELLPGDPDYPHFAVQGKLIYRSIQNFSGETICEYYYNPDLYWQISFTMSQEDRMPVTVITNQAVYDAWAIFQTVELILYLLIALDFVVAAGIYLMKAKKVGKTV